MLRIRDEASCAAGAYVDVSQPVQNVLRVRFDYNINEDAIDQVLIEAAKVRLATIRHEGRATGSVVSGA